MSLPWITKPSQTLDKKEKYWIIDYSFYMYNGSFAHRYKCRCRSPKTNEPRSNCAKCGGDGHTYMQSQDGHPTGGLYTIFGQAIQMAKQGYKVITVFDPPKEQLDRMKLLDTYKAGRPPVPDWITFQMDYGQDLLLHTGIECYYSDHAESDDVMAALAIKLADEGHYVVVSSDDKDMFPLLGHKNIDLYRQRQMFTEKSFHSHLKKKEGIEIKDPSRFNEFLAVCGDAADNFNLISGLGPKAAEYLIANTKSSVIEAFDDIGSLPMKYQKKLIVCSKPAPAEGEKPIKCPEKKDCRMCKYFEGTKKTDMILSLRIATLDHKADYRQINKEPNKEKVRELLGALDLKGALKDIEYLF